MPLERAILPHCRPAVRPRNEREVAIAKRSFPSRRLLALFTFFAGLALPAAAGADARVSRTYAQLPLHFEVNRGQAHEDVRFLARGSGYSLYLTPREAVFVLVKPNPDKKRDWHGKRDWRSQHERPKMQGVMLRMAIVAAHPAPLVSGLEELPGRANYFIGNDPAQWRTNVPTYAKVHYREVYPGIDLVYYGNQRQLEYDFIVAPGADPQSIVLDFQGADRVEVNAKGELVLHTAVGSIRQQKPIIYQEIDGVRREIAGGYVLQGTNQVGFQVPAHDRSRPLVIDPVLAYSTYLGGSVEETGVDIAVDADGNAYVTGNVSSFNFPTTAGAFQTTCAADPRFCHDVAVTKLNPTGSALVYSTYLGGSDLESGTGIAVDATGSAYVTGQTWSTNFPTTAGAFQTTYGGNVDGFVTKLDAAGSALVYSTYLGSSGGDTNIGIAVDTAGNAYVSGFTDSTSFPTTGGAFQTTYGGGSKDSYVTKLNPAGSALVYSTYLGGNGLENPAGVAVDADGNAYVSGYTDSTNFPTTAGAFQPLFAGGIWDAFVAKLDPTGSALVYSTYLGGDSRDFLAGFSVDADGNVYVTGQTFSTNFPITAGAFQTTFGGGEFDAFVTKLNPTGSALVYSTFLGGSADDLGRGIAVDAAGNAYVSGATNSINFPTIAGAFQTTYGGGEFDAFVTKLNPTGSALVYSTFIGGSEQDGGFGIAVDTAGSAYVTGRTYSTDFPTTTGAFQPTFGGNGDAFVAKIIDDTSPPPTTTTTRSEESAATHVGPWMTYGSEVGTFSGGTIVASNLAASTATFSFSGTALSWIGVKCNVCGIAAVSIDGGVPTTVNTAGPAAPGSLTSVVVYSASGLAAGNHTIAITVTGASSSDNTYIAVDAFDVTEGGATSPPSLAGERVLQPP